MSVTLISTQGPTKSAQVNTNTFTWALTVPASCQYLVVFFSGNHNVASAVSANLQAQAMTLIRAHTDHADYVEGYYLASPTTGARTLNLVWANANNQFEMCAMYLTGVDTARVVVDSANGDTTANVTPTNVGDMVLAMGMNEDGGDIDVSGGNLTSLLDGGAGGDWWECVGYISPPATLAARACTFDADCHKMQAAVIGGILGGGSPMWWF